MTTATAATPRCLRPTERKAAWMASTSAWSKSGCRMDTDSTTIPGWRLFTRPWAEASASTTAVRKTCGFRRSRSRHCKASGASVSPAEAARRCRAEMQLHVGPSGIRHGEPDTIAGLEQQLRRGEAGHGTQEPTPLPPAGRQAARATDGDPSCAADAARPRRASPPWHRRPAAASSTRHGRSARAAAAPTRRMGMAAMLRTHRGRRGAACSASRPPVSLSYSPAAASRTACDSSIGSAGASRGRVSA